METHFKKVKKYLQDLGFEIASEDMANEILLITDEERGVLNLVIDCEEPLLVFEQFIGVIRENSTETYKRLLQMNRQLVHGAFVLDSDSDRLLFRDTLQLKNLDENEVEGTISALSLALSEYGNELIKICK